MIKIGNLNLDSDFDYRVIREEEAQYTCSCACQYIFCIAHVLYEQHGFKEVQRL